MLDYTCECSCCVILSSLYFYCFILYVHFLIIVKYFIPVVNSIHIKDTNNVCIYHNWDTVSTWRYVQGGVAIYMIVMAVSLFFMF